MKILTAAVMMLFCGTAFAFPVPPFYASVEAHSPLFAEPLVDRTLATQQLEGHTFIQTARIKTDCGSDLISTIKTQIQANALNGGHTGFVRIRIHHKPAGGGHPDHCQRQALTEILPISAEREIDMGQQEISISHPLYPKGEYTLKIAYQPVEPDKVHILKAVLESEIPKN